MKSYFKLFLLSLVFGLFSSCSDDEDGSIKEIQGLTGEYLTFSDITIKQLVNDAESCDLLAQNDELVLSSTVTFADKKINWSRPTFEMHLDPLLFSGNEDFNFEVKSSNGTITNEQYKYKLSANSDKLQIEISFLDSNKDNHAYLSGNTLDIKVTTKLKSDLAIDDLNRLRQQGASARSYFYGTSFLVNAKSNKVTTYLNKESEPLYNVKGDPRNDEYKYKLNVVYFVPSDQEAHYLYRHRISEILMKHQLWTIDQMKQWGYEAKSFGLPLREDGTVDIVFVEGEKTSEEYNASSVAIDNGNMIKEEINEYYKKNNLKKYSDHTLVIYPLDYYIKGGGGSAAVPMPFYGSDKWCFALDYPFMSYEHLSLDKNTEIGSSSTWIGAMLHELGHALNMIHVGSSSIQEAEYGLSLMGNGSYNYGRGSVFLHPIDAATLNNCQVSSFVEKDFYGTTSSKINLTDLSVNEKGELTVKGSFASTEKVTDIALRFFDSKERHLDNSGNYTSVGFVIKPNSDGTFQKIFTAEDIKNKNFTEFKVGVSALLDNGSIVTNASSHRFSIDGQNIVKLTYDRSEWIVTLNQDLATGVNGASNTPMNLFDNNFTTSLLVVNRGKSFGGVTASTMVAPAIDIDMLDEREFDRIKITYPSNIGLGVIDHKLRSLAIRANNNPDGFVAGSIGVQIYNNTKLVPSGATSIIIDLDEPVKYRHIKINCNAGSPNSNYFLFSEIEVEKR